jgi:hypothetical protein
MPLVSKSSAFACRAERLAWAGACPRGTVIRPSGISQRVAPHADPCEEVALGISVQVVGFDIFNAPFVYFAGRNVPSGNQAT